MPWGVAAAAVAAGGAIYSSNQASNAQESAANSASNVSSQQYQQTRADQAPWRIAGGQAVNALSQFWGLGGTNGAPQNLQMADLFTGVNGTPTVNPTLYSNDPAYKYAWDTQLQRQQQQFGQGYNSKSDPSMLTNQLLQLMDEYKQQNPSANVAGGNSALTSDGVHQGLQAGNTPDFSSIISNLPGYQFNLQQGEQAVQRNLASRGLLSSGAGAKALTQFGQGLASNYGQQYVSGLESLAGLGQTSAQATGSLGANTANKIGQNTIYAGNAQAANYTNQSNAINAG